MSLAMNKFTGLPAIDVYLVTSEETVNDRGNRTRHTFLLEADRYIFDFNLDSQIWEQFDTDSDAWYFGTWLNKSELRIFQYAEGDLCFTQCDTAEGYDREIAALCAFHEASPAYVVIDDEAVTHYYQDRSTLYIHPPAKPEAVEKPEGSEQPDTTETDS